MLIAIGLIAAGGIFLVFLGLALRPATSTGQMLQQRLMAYEDQRPISLEEQELQLPFTERFLRPFIERVGRRLSDRTPEKARQDLQNKLNLAGRPFGLSSTDFMVVRYVATVVLGLAGLLLGWLSQSPVWLIVFTAVGGATGLFYPRLWLDQKVRGRRKEIQKSLPDALDLLTIAVEAGLGFDAALARVTDKFKNALADEFATVLQETRLGRPRLESLDDMGRRTGVEDLHNFVQAVIQSEQMGVGIARVLRIQSDEIRRRRRQRAQEKGAQASLKMLFPMVGCIFPTLWILLLGPGLLGVVEAGVFH
ncbi:MAG TPA: type II secretion system F family protein [Candidatus Dormibacteraeota bacterium]